MAIIATLAKASGVYILQKYEFYSLVPLHFLNVLKLDDARKGARKGKGNIVMVGKKGNKVRLEIVQNLLSLRL